MQLFASWSGGKDSCLALHRMVQFGHTCASLFTMIDETGEHSRSHGLPPQILQAQAQALGLPLLMGQATWDCYEEQFKANLSRLRAESLEHGVFGDIDVQSGRDWVERVCADAGVTPHEPLWLEERASLVREFAAAGFKAIMVVVDTDRVPVEYLGREIDESLIGELEALGVDASGELGEFHTFVFDGPLFSHPVAFTRGEVIRLGKHAMLPVAVE